MFIVAVTRWARPFDQELATLAPILNIGQYDLRLRLAGPLPVVVAQRLEEDFAKKILAVLVERGHGALACDASQVSGSEEMFTPRIFAFESMSFVILDKEQRQVPFADILALIQATCSISDTKASTSKKKKFSLTRTAMTGGLVRSKKVSKESRVESVERQQVLYVFQRTGQNPIFLSESRLQYSGLGDKMKAASPENFSSLVTLLREQAPAAFYDDRLARQPRASGQIRVSGSAKDRKIVQSNASENDLAVHLIVQAHLLQQL
ncbi:MAG: hypothetical protein JRJ19_06555 [Deltaproteobacteria bacterium]|nr:hypothetical protein [Deltaproteobacteria bacterium]MBW1871706.1 hypothetical protein [Deltaproteobacteria bacterium]